ncbi:type II toxin-antitoxin system RelE/ParE family toxin [Halpernia frigidisoli]|uniref:ParE toxin of type II toxin-antitoxin system, parDE n=1 Tax=Halpernia frigidisoli TaxID=1125876 RepID=A0A1I3IKD5_9FLAO|nr:type II toxin-antitoxin system RelE/ParE family toxin [Halpernia frigidisoli]SFI48485.1 ParE toxin of type II toxin-antitoxin system, parDE [Halpernia frigidisoli]
MNYEIEFLIPAAEEFEEAISWYEDKKIGLGFEFAHEIEEYLSLIENNPYLFEKHQDKYNLHKVPLVRFPYSIIYWIDDDKKIIYIDAILHAKRKPKFE